MCSNGHAVLSIFCKSSFSLDLSQKMSAAASAVHTSYVVPISISFSGFLSVNLIVLTFLGCPFTLHEQIFYNVSHFLPLSIPLSPPSRLPSFLKNFKNSDFCMGAYSPNFHQVYPPPPYKNHGYFNMAQLPQVTISTPYHHISEEAGIYLGTELPVYNLTIGNP